MIQVQVSSFEIFAVEIFIIEHFLIWGTGIVILKLTLSSQDESTYKESALKIIET